MVACKSSLQLEAPVVTRCLAPSAKAYHERGMSAYNPVQTCIAAGNLLQERSAGEAQEFCEVGLQRS